MPGCVESRHSNGLCVARACARCAAWIQRLQCSDSEELHELLVGLRDTLVDLDLEMEPNWVNCHDAVLGQDWECLDTMSATDPEAMAVLKRVRLTIATTPEQEAEQATWDKLRNMMFAQDHPELSPVEPAEERAAAKAQLQASMCVGFCGTPGLAVSIVGPGGTLHAARG